MPPATDRLENISLRFRFGKTEQMQVDDTTRALRGVSIITGGNTADGRFNITPKFLDEVVERCAAKTDGVKCRFDHPSWMGPGSIGSYLGRARNFKKDGNQVRGDIEFSPVAELSPIFPRDPVPYLLAVAKKDPGVLGLSIVFSPLWEQPGPAVDGTTPDQILRCADLDAVDFVDDPNANPKGLFSNGASAPQPKEAEMADQKTAPDAEQIRKEERERLNIFLSAFPNDQAFAAEQCASGATLDEAKIAHDRKRLAELERKSAEQQAALDAKAKENVALQAKIDETSKTPPPPGVPPASGTTGSTERFANMREAVDSIQREQKLSRIEAAKEAAKRYPDLVAQPWPVFNGQRAK